MAALLSEHNKDIYKTTLNTVKTICMLTWTSSFPVFYTNMHYETICRIVSKNRKHDRGTINYQLGSDYFYLF